MAQEKKANLKAADKAADKEAKAKDAALQAAKTQIERQFGQGSLMRLGDQDAIEIEAISTGALSLDLALGVGGVPRGRVVEIFGPDSSGKTTLVYHIIAEAQALGGICAFVDTEHAIDPIYAKRIGVDVDELLVSQPDYGEQALEIVDVLVRFGAVDLVAIESWRRDAARRARGPDGGDPGRTPGAPDVAGAPQADREPEPGQHHLRVHQPDPREDRRHLRLAGDPARWARAEVLFVPAARHPPHRDPQGGHRGGRRTGSG